MKREDLVHLPAGGYSWLGELLGHGDASDGQSERRGLVGRMGLEVLCDLDVEVVLVVDVVVQLLAILLDEDA